MAKFSDAENEAYKRGLAAGQKKSGKKSSSSKGKGGKKGKGPKSSGCVYEESYKAGPKSKFGSEGETVNRPKIWGWRRSKLHGFQTFTAFLSKDNGAPQNGTSSDDCLVFVVNLQTEGRAPERMTAVWSKKYRKLSMTDAQLVANPFANDGGYFGRGGSRFKDKVK
jgi:hypothetical protein